MRERPTERMERGRLLHGPYGSTPDYGCTGAFIVKYGPVTIRVLASDGSGWKMSGKPWEHVSVTLNAPRCPTWEEMDWVKRQFWRDDETVMQLHVPRSTHVNAHETCLHLWRPVGFDIPLPPTEAVGPSEFITAKQLAKLLKQHGDAPVTISPPGCSSVRVVGVTEVRGEARLMTEPIPTGEPTGELAQSDRDS